MSGGEDPRDADFEEANVQLSQGLKCCRSVIANYRSMLAGEPPANEGGNRRTGSLGYPTSPDDAPLGEAS